MVEDVCHCAAIDVLLWGRKKKKIAMIAQHFLYIGCVA